MCFLTTLFWSLRVLLLWLSAPSINPILCPSSSYLAYDTYAHITQKNKKRSISVKNFCRKIYYHSSCLGLLWMNWRWRYEEKEPTKNPVSPTFVYTCAIIFLPVFPVCLGDNNLVAAGMEEEEEEEYQCQFSSDISRNHESMKIQAVILPRLFRGVLKNLVNRSKLGWLERAKIFVMRRNRTYDGHLEHTYAHYPSLPCP